MSAAELIAPRPLPMTLALDLGTRCGWAAGANERAAVHGVWDLKPTRFSGGGMRFVRFRNYLDELHDLFVFRQVVFEEVRRHQGTDAAHVYGGLMATLQAWCEDNKVPYEAVPVGVIKKHWTGKGNADKASMVAQALLRGLLVEDDNEADALALHDYWMTTGRRS